MGGRKEDESLDDEIMVGGVIHKYTFDQINIKGV